MFHMRLNETSINFCKTETLSYFQKVKLLYYYKRCGYRLFVQLYTHYVALLFTIGRCSRVIKSFAVGLYHTLFSRKVKVELTSYTRDSGDTGVSISNNNSKKILHVQKFNTFA